MSAWLPKSGHQTSAEYAYAEVSVFNRAVVRAYRAMQRAQACAQVILPSSLLGWYVPLRHSVWCCRVADNTPPRLGCQDREMTLRIVRPWLMGVDPKSHGGPWLSRELIFSFIAGLTEGEVLDHLYVCKCAIGLPCPGRKANEAHQLLRDLERDKKKEKRLYAPYEPSEAELAND